jgi:hypothetical protein
MKFAGSSHRSHFGQKGKGTAQVFPLGSDEKNVVSKCISLDPQVEQKARNGCVAKERKIRSSMPARFDEDMSPAYA